MALFGKKKESDLPPPPGMQPEMPQPEMAPDVPPQDYSQQGYYPEQSADQPYQDYPQPEAQYSQESVQEVAEAIIDEKWNELVKDINKVIEWKERTDTELKKIQQEIVNLKERFESLHRGVLGKISEYDQNLSHVGTEIKAMEMAFQKILPTFTENVNKLERISKGMPVKD